uniref:Uncharacterized protein n=1 Tax=Streptomyces sp. F12 TaxID=1436084 RepID=V9Z9Y5_9ACTN|nr:hypothetical protein pFRL6_154c [Streptomyces sp. F12]
MDPRCHRPPAGHVMEALGIGSPYVVSNVVVSVGKLPSRDSGHPAIHRRRTISSRRDAEYAAGSLLRCHVRPQQLLQPGWHVPLTSLNVPAAPVR